MPTLTPATPKPWSQNGQIDRKTVRALSAHFASFLHLRGLDACFRFPRDRSFAPPRTTSACSGALTIHSTEYVLVRSQSSVRSLDLPAFVADRGQGTAGSPDTGTLARHGRHRRRRRLGSRLRRTETAHHRGRLCRDRPGRLRGHHEKGRPLRLGPQDGRAGKELHRRDQWFGCSLHRLRQRRMARHLSGQRIDLRCSRWQRRRRPTPRSSTTTTTEPSPMCRQGRRHQRPLGLRRQRGRLRQRRLARHLCRQLRQEPPLPQQPRRHLYRHGGEGRRGAGQLVSGVGMGRL